MTEKTGRKLANSIITSKFTVLTNKYLMNVQSKQKQPVEIEVMASVLAAQLREKSAGIALAYQAKLLDFTSVRNIKFIFNPFHQRVESIRCVIIA